jgi:hypothetical protein
VLFFLFFYGDASEIVDYNSKCKNENIDGLEDHIKIAACKQEQ